MTGSALGLLSVGVGIAALGVLHLWKTDGVFAFYKSFNDRQLGEFIPWRQMVGGASREATRIVGWGLVAIGVMAFVGGLTEL